MIHFDQLTYTYPGADAPALAQITLDIAEGQFVLVAGPSGGGKSTLLRCLNGLVPHFSGGRVRGRIMVAGFDAVAAGPPILSREVGFVFQDPEAQFVLDHVEDEIAFALENAALPRDEMRLRVEEALRLLELAPLRDRPLATLSGGEKQRVAIAAALALRPRILVLDEPTSQLDPQSAEEVLQALVRLNQDLGLTIVLAEHRLERVLPYADQMIYLAPASPVQSGPPRDVLAHVPLTPPLVTLGKALGWSPLPLTLVEARPFAQKTALNAKPRESKISRRAPLLRVAGLDYAYHGKPALRDVSLTIGAGELVALMGRNGSGKTTLLKCIVGLLKPAHGALSLAGRSLAGRDVASICRDVGYLPQTSDDLLFADTVADEISITLRNHGLLAHPPTPPATLLARLNLTAVCSHYPRDLSVGQRQRVALGAICATRPSLLLLDEPTRGLDYETKWALLQLLREWQAEGTAILLATHDVELAAQAAERVVILSAGEIVADAAPETLAASPLFAPQVARLFPGRGWLTPEDVFAEA
ncbi:MAG: energy-coupling factor ABC transporter ATP-binding protein [Anaerolineae bacterium]|nr:energy-coupling factor ABC transporter ATP-binding protein [Anaerolineae bacterium]